VYRLAELERVPFAYPNRVVTQVLLTGVKLVRTALVLLLCKGADDLGGDMEEEYGCDEG